MKKKKNKTNNNIFKVATAYFSSLAVENHVMISFKIFMKIRYPLDHYT